MMRPAFLATLMVLSCVLLSCGSSSGGTSTAPSSNNVTLTSDTYTLKPGEEEFYCYAMTLKSDIVITGFTPTYGKATHHILFVQTLAEEPDGFSNCHVLIKTTWSPLFVGGVETSPLKLPDGVGMKLTAGTQILLQLHLLNSGAEPVTDKTGVTLEGAADPTAPFTPAGIFGLDDEKISIPAGAANFQQSMGCTPGKQMNVFGYFGHMHRIGTHLNLQVNGQSVVDEGWNFDAQPTTLKNMVINPTDQLKLTCTYTNTTDQAVTWGESTLNEMCAFVFYYTKYDGLDGCQQM